MSASKSVEVTPTAKPRVSVVIPAYNAQPSIRTCLDALMQQDYPRDLYEVIVVDDGSVDATGDIVQGYPVRYVYQQNTGPAAARNQGAQKADGEILLFTDADCIPDANWIGEMVIPFRNTRVAAVKGAYRNKNKRLLARFAQIEFEERYAMLAGEDSIDMIDTYSAGYRKEIFYAMGGFDSRFPCANNEDTELSYRLAAKSHRMVFNPNAIVRHLGHPDTVAKYFKLKFARGYWRMIVYRQFPEKMIRDTYTPQSLKLQIIALFLVAICIPVPALAGALGLIFPLGAALLFIFFSIPFMRFAWRKDIVVGLCSPFLIATRAAALGLGAAWAVLRGACFSGQFRQHEYKRKTFLETAMQAQDRHSLKWKSSYWRQLLQSKLTWFVTGSQVIVDLVTIYCSILGGYGLYGYQFPAEEAYFAQYAHLAAAGTLIGFIVFERVGLYRYQPSMMNLIEIRKILRAVVLIFLALVGYAYYIGSTFSAGAFIYAFCLATMLLLGERMLFFKLQQQFHLSGFSIRRVLIHGAGETGRLLFHGISQTPKLGYSVAAFYDQDKQQLETARSLCSREAQDGPVFVGNPDQLSAVIRENEIEEIFVSNPLHDGDSQDLEKVRQLCRELQIKLSFIPYMRGYSARQVQVNDINGITMISFGEIRISHAEQMSKRIFDLFLASIILLVLSPVFALISMAIKRDSAGPVFFKQVRVGKDGVHFPMFKFRTMHVDSPEYGRSPRTADDPRITALGKFLRRTSLDELPQLINVLRGEMSLVGPRPEMPFIVDNEYSDIHRERLRVMPGITGVWQISADRSREIHENISYDLFYIENRSLLLDIIILARTLIFGIMAMRTY